MEGFSDADRDVALGHVLGLRWFQLTTRNVRIAVPNPEFLDIHKVTYATPHMVQRTVEQPALRGARGIWEPGVNHARCLVSPPLMQPRRKDGSALHPENHPVPVRDCHCGFWAYWHLGAQQANAPHVAGLVKGYGRVIQGPVGFRCDTAEIVALVPLIPDEYAALALEAIYQVDVYGTIEALLEMHKAPPTQQPLADDYFHMARMAAKQQAARNQNERGRRVNESHMDYARRIGFLPDYSAPCLRCGTVSRGAGQGLCGPCQQATEMLNEMVAKHIAGTDAQAQLHARREAWAKTTPSILGLGGPDVIEPPNAARHQIKWALEYIKERFADGSWWRQQGPPQ